MPDSNRLTIGFLAVCDKQPTRKAPSSVADALLQNLPKVGFDQTMWK
jgi:hypothetical protein